MAVAEDSHTPYFEYTPFRIQHLLPPFLVPQGQFQKHLHTLANLAKLLHKQDFPDARTEMETVVIRAFHF